MDIARPGAAKKRRRRNLLIGALVMLGIALASLGLGRLKPAPPSVDKQTVWIGTVERGPMDRQVRGSGTLVPVDIRLVSANVDGRVDRLPYLAGVTVNPDTIIIELSNPEVEQSMIEAESQLKAAEADFKNQVAQLESQLLNQRGQLNQAESLAEQAQLQAQADKKLAEDGLIPEITMKLSSLKSGQLAKQAKIEKERYSQAENANHAQLDALRAKLGQLRALFELRSRQVESLKVRAGIPGILQELPVQVGQRCTAGTVLARVSRPDKLKAQVKIPETQIKDVLPGQSAEIDTRSGVVEGKVSRISPQSESGTVTVDVELPSQLPPGARPDLSIDGTIEIEHLDNVLHVGRPAYGQPQSKIEMFRLVEGGKEAVRVPVMLGRSSVNTIEIVRGLNVGDQVILSDTSAQDGFDRIRLN